MPKCVVVVREAGGNHPDFSLSFDLPEVPAVGSYLSICRPDVPEPYSEDAVVRNVWWRLRHPETGVFASDPEKVGALIEIVVECDPAIGPHASDRWREGLAAARLRGAEVENFRVSRFSVRQDELTLRGASEIAD